MVRRFCGSCCAIEQTCGSERDERNPYTWLPSGGSFFVSKPAKCTTWICLFITKGDYVMRMKNPPHPGRIVRRECIEPLGLTVTETAKRLGVTRQALNNLVNGNGGISAEMAVRLSKAF